MHHRRFPSADILFSDLEICNRCFRESPDCHGIRCHAGIGKNARDVSSQSIG